MNLINSGKVTAAFELISRQMHGKGRDGDDNNITWRRKVRDKTREESKR